jgi:hypothetical protein
MAAQETIPGMEPFEKQQTALTVIERAILSPDTNADQLAKLLEVKLRYEADEARKNFEHAFALFKANAPKIEKTRHVSFATRGGDKTEYWHAELDKITETIGNALRSVGIVHSFKTSDQGGRTTVTCILNGFGHTHEGSTLSGPPDTSGGKNNVQAIGSTVTYLQRYTLLTTCGLAAENQDDDGKTEGLPESTITDYCIQMQDCRSLDELKSSFAECWDKAKKVNDEEAKARFRKVYEQRKKEVGQ